MSQYLATVQWTRHGPDFLKGLYSREHTWSFDAGVSIMASSSPAVVPTPWANPARVDPEEAFVASVSSCHMLTFVWLASKEGFVPDRYRDEAVGVMTKNDKGVPWMSTITLRPAIAWSGTKKPTEAEVQRLHHEAHEQCYIANSIKTEVRVEAPLEEH